MSQPRTTLRQREDADMPAICAVFSDPTFVHSAAAGQRFETPAHVQLWLDQMGEHGRVEIVADLEQEVAGFGGLFMGGGNQSHVGSLVMGVRQEHQRKGIGTMILRGLIGIADQILNVHRLQLTVYGDNPVALRMYLAHGFEIEGLHRAFVRRDNCYVDTFSMSRVGHVGSDCRGCVTTSERQAQQ